MAKVKITDMSATRASNSDIDGINIAEGCPAGNHNDAMRELMVQLAEANAGTYPVADTWSFADPADLTKIVRLDAGGVTAGQTRVLTAPDYNGTIATLAGTETITNKTLTTPTITLKQATGPTPTAEGDMQWDTDDNAIVVGDGSGQKIFRANAWELISTSTPSAAASVEFTGLSAYRKLRITAFLAPANDAVDTYLRTSSNNGVTYDSAAANYDYQNLTGSSTTAGAVRGTLSYLPLAGTFTSGNATGEGVQIECVLEQFNQAAYMFASSHFCIRGIAGTLSTGVVAAGRLEAVARDAIQILFSAGNIASGHIMLEGVRG